MRILLALALLLALVPVIGCGNPGSTIVTQVGEDSWRTLKPTDVQVRLGELDSGELALARKDQVIAHGPVTVGTTLPVTIDDLACAVLVRNTFEGTASGYRPSMNREPGQPAPHNRDRVNTTLRGLTLELRCADAPVPGTDASLRGARSLPSLPWGLPGLILGLICGLLARPQNRDGRRMEKAGTFGILSLIAAGVCAKAMLDDAYIVTYGVLFAAWAIAGIVGGRLAEPRGRHTAAAFTITALLVPFAFTLLWPLWTIGAPIVALLAGAALALTALVIAVSIKPTYG
ncbi:MAG: hypothetical protein IPL61_27910 [Myxococcales bacterium]|nr:hypothetical protein [Myxococcales bacterium]